MTKATDTEILLIAAVRADPTVGRGSCSVIDECFTDNELLAFLRRAAAESPADAVKAAQDHEAFFRDVGADITAEAF